MGLLDKIKSQNTNKDQSGEVSNISLDLSKQ